MTNNYKQLSLELRFQIEVLVKTGMKQKMIATNIDVDPSTVSRELSRGALNISWLEKSSYNTGETMPYHYWKN